MGKQTQSSACPTALAPHAYASSFSIALLCNTGGQTLLVTFDGSRLHSVRTDIYIFRSMEPSRLWSGRGPAVRMQAEERFMRTSRQPNFWKPSVPARMLLDLCNSRPLPLQECRNLTVLTEHKQHGLDDVDPVVQIRQGIVSAPSIDKRGVRGQT